MKKVRPPENLEGEALLEWERVTSELKELGTLDQTDRAVLTLYCQTWEVNQANAKHVAKYGAVIKWSNGLPGESPWFKVLKATTAQLSKLVDQLGLTPAVRAKLASPSDEPMDITF